MSTETFQGADVQALRTLRTAMQGFVAELQRSSATTSSALDALAWAGNDRSSFHSAWTDCFRPVMQSVADAVTRAADQVEANAADQERASSDTGTGGGVTAGASGALGASLVQERRLGSLSEQHESGGRGPGAVSTGWFGPGRRDPGGISYGVYQFSTDRGSAQEFVDGLRTTHPDYYAALSPHRPGTREFSDAWRALADRDPEGFREAQHDAIQRTHYEPQFRNVERRLPGIDLAGRDPVVRDVVWSSAVQHRNYTDDIFVRAVGGRDVTTLSDADLIRGVYAERSRRFPSLNPRWRAEERDALAALGQ